MTEHQPPRPSFPPPGSNTPPPPAGHPYPAEVSLTDAEPRVAGPVPVWGAMAITTIATVAVTVAVWLASKDALSATPPDGHHLWVPVASFAAAGLLWGLIQPGARRALRAMVGLAVGAGVGAIGGFSLGTTERHIAAFQDKVLSGASFGRAGVWALAGAAAWAAVVAAGTPKASRMRTSVGAAVGGAAIGAVMGLLAGTPLGKTNLIATDTWFAGWIAIDDNVGRLLPVVVLSVLAPLATATAFGRSVGRPSKAPMWVAGALCLLIPFAGAGLGNASAIEANRGDGPTVSIDGGAGFSSSESASPSAAGSGDETAGDNDSSAAPASPGASGDDSTSPVTAVTEAPSAPPESAPDEAGGEVVGDDSNAVPVTEVPVTSEGKVFIRPVVATDIDVGFPIATDLRLSGTNTLDQGVQVRLVVGEAVHNDKAPATPNSSLSCSVDPHDGVFPFYLQVTPYAAGLSRVRVAFSQGATGLADTALNAMTVEFHETNGPRCENAVDPDFANTTTSVVWESLADGENGGEYGYFIVAGYYDDGGNPVGAGSAVVGPVLDLNRTYTSWTTTVNGSISVLFDTGDGYSGGALYLTP